MTGYEFALWTCEASGERWRRAWHAFGTVRPDGLTAEVWSDNGLIFQSRRVSRRVPCTIGRAKSSSHPIRLSRMHFLRASGGVRMAAQLQHLIEAYASITKWIQWYNILRVDRLSVIAAHVSSAYYNLEHYIPMLYAA